MEEATADMVRVFTKTRTTPLPIVTSADAVTAFYFRHATRHRARCARPEPVSTQTHPPALTLAEAEEDEEHQEGDEGSPE